MRTFDEIAADLKEAEARLAAAKAEMRAYLDQGPTETPRAPAGPEETRPQPIGERILAALHGATRLTVAELAQRCGTTPTRAFREALSRLHRTGRVRAVERGVYRAS